MPTIRHVVAEKGDKIVSVHPNATVFEAIKKMAEHNIGSLAVLDDGRLVGIFTERHYARNVFLRGRASPETRVGEVMERKVAFIRSDQSVEEGMAIMSEQRVRHLPVIDDDELVGLVSIGDLVKSVIDDKEFVIGQLEHYIHG